MNKLNEFDTYYSKFYKTYQSDPDCVRHRSKSLQLNIIVPIASREGHLDVLRDIWAYSGVGWFELPGLEVEGAFYIACAHGRLEVLKWMLLSCMHHHFPNSYNPSPAVRKSFFESVFGVRVKRERAFRVACWRGHLEVAQWLLREFPEIETDIEDDEAFWGAVEHGQLGVVQWLYEVREATGRGASSAARSGADDERRTAGGWPVATGRRILMNATGAAERRFRDACYGCSIMSYWDTLRWVMERTDTWGRVIALGYVSNIWRDENARNEFIHWMMRAYPELRSARFHTSAVNKRAVVMMIENAVNVGNELLAYWLMSYCTAEEFWGTSEIRTAVEWLMLAQEGVAERRAAFMRELAPGIERRAAA